MRDLFSNCLRVGAVDGLTSRRCRVHTLIVAATAVMGTRVPPTSALTQKRKAVMSNTMQDPSAFLASAPQAHRVQRDGERDLSFQGWKLSEECVSRGGRVGNDGDRERKTCVTIFVTAGGRYVVEVWRAKYSVNPASGVVESDVEADTLVTESPEELFAFLKDSNRGSFGQASREAWNAACALYKPLAPFATDTID